MQMISIAKLNRIEKPFLALRPYFSGLEAMLANVLSSSGFVSSPYLEKRQEIKKICLCIVASDSGLCGSYNNNVIHLAEKFIEEKGIDKVGLVVVGRKALRYFQKQGIGIFDSYTGLNGRYSQKVSDEIAERLRGLFLSAQADEVYFVYTHFETALLCRPMIKKFLSIELAPSLKREYLFEPNIDLILGELILRYISMKTGLILFEAFTAEHAARTIAMKSATDNADELLRSQVLVRNKLRQALITEDIMEIISSSEALKG